MTPGLNGIYGATWLKNKTNGKILILKYCNDFWIPFQEPKDCFF